MTLKFEDEDEEVKRKQRQPAIARADVTNDPILPPREDKSKRRLYPLNSPSRIEKRWNSCSSAELTPISSVDLPTVSDYNGSHPQEVIFRSHFYRICTVFFNRSGRDQGETLHGESIIIFFSHKFFSCFIYFMLPSNAEIDC